MYRSDWAGIALLKHCLWIFPEKNSWPSLSDSLFYVSRHWLCYYQMKVCTRLLIYFSHQETPDITSKKQLTGDIRYILYLESQGVEYFTQLPLECVCCTAGPIITHTYDQTGDVMCMPYGVGLVCVCQPTC